MYFQSYQHFWSMDWFQNITQLMSCVHGSHNRFENKASGCWNPSCFELKVEHTLHQLIASPHMLVGRPIASSHQQGFPFETLFSSGSNWSHQSCHSLVCCCCELQLGYFSNSPAHLHNFGHQIIVKSQTSTGLFLKLIGSSLTKCRSS